MLLSLIATLAIAVPGPIQSDNQEHGEPPVKAPFGKLDNLATNDWWNRKPNKILNLKVPRDEVLAFGLYTVHNDTLKMSDQLFPLYPNETREVSLWLEKDGEWVEAARSEINDLGWSAVFRMEDWDNSKSFSYRLQHGESARFEGIIRKDPGAQEEIVLAALSCNSNQDRGARTDIVNNLRHIDPDLLFFAGDQSYDHKQHTAAWLLWGMQFRDIFRDRPCITIPDDHDIGQGNIWGESGKVAKLAGGADGGYFHHPEYVKLVERSQTAHLPDPFDPTPVLRGIRVYYTNLVVGGVDFAILEDRKFKSGPAGKIPRQGPRPDHILNPEYDPKSIDLDGLVLLGDRQLTFLSQWGSEKSERSMKAVLSQTGFCGAAHLHGKKENRLHADLDSNGWPQSGRRKALRLIQAAGAVHIAGDQHIATLLQHGIDKHGDGPWAFVVPAIVNNYYGRWWWPEDEKPGAQHDSASPLPWTGDYLDGFGNAITMHAYANPESAARGAGFGVIRFHKPSKRVTFDCWPRNVDVKLKSAQQFAGWPHSIQLPKD